MDFGQMTSLLDYHRCSRSDQIGLVANEGPGNIWTERVLTALVHPQRQIAETNGVSDIKHEDNPVHIAIVVLNHTFTKTFLTSSVPHLYLKRDGRGQDLYFCSHIHIIAHYTFAMHDKTELQKH